MRIVKNGLYNDVNEQLFEKVYKPQGWKRADEQDTEVKVENQAIAEQNGQQKIIELNDNKKRQKTKKFDDNIIKEA